MQSKLSIFSSSGRLDHVEHLLKLVMKPIYDQIKEADNKIKECLGLLSLMMGSSKFNCVHWIHKKFQNELSIVQQIVVTKGTMKTDPTCDKLVTIGMNKNLSHLLCQTSIRRHQGSINFFCKHWGNYYFRCE